MSAAQLFLKKGMLEVGEYPQDMQHLLPFFFKAFTNGYVLLCIFLSIVTAIAWIMAVSKAQLSLIYPFIALSYVLVTFFSMIFFKETVTIIRWIGIAVICAGIFLVARG
jgi:drug/metabolite transporter (DMT)-like permease